MTDFKDWDYLGDSVYVHSEEWGEIVLALNNGYGFENVIILEPEVLDNLKKFISRKESENK